MAFVDEARIFIKAGDGGKGCESFYRERYFRYSRPNGGDGGKGGDVIFVADKSIQTLLDYRFKQHYKAGRGGHGGSKGKTGKQGEDCILKVPEGTILRDYESKLLIRDLKSHGNSVVVARGGSGGHGNLEHKNPRPPGLGQEKVVHLELKLIADAGLVGFPNAGKSTLINQVSKVKSKIAQYPFTTKQPILGVVENDDGTTFIIADLPGLIEGAHQGKGLGHRFLRHAERTKILVHLIDMAGSEGRDPLDDYAQITNELLSYSEEFLGKEKIVVANKMDLPEAKDHLKRFKKKFDIDIVQISALEKKGLDRLLKKINKLLLKAKK